MLALVHAPLVIVTDILKRTILCCSAQAHSMYAALRKLGNVDSNERVRRFVLEQRHHTDRALDVHDHDCICRDCERQQCTFRLSYPLTTSQSFILTPL